MKIYVPNYFAFAYMNSQTFAKYDQSNHIEVVCTLGDHVR